MNNRAFIVGSIFGGIIATIVVGNVLSHCRSINTETTDSEPKETTDSEPKTDNTVSYSDAVNAIIGNTSMLSTLKQEIIGSMSVDMSEDIYKSIICIAQDENMLNAVKCNTIIDICDRFREKNMVYNEKGCDTYVN